MAYRFPAMGLLALMLTGCADTGLTPSASVTTASPAWEHFFRLEVTPHSGPAGTEFDGYIYNLYGRPAGSVQLLAQALDTSDNVVAQRLEWVPGTVPALNRSYFRISALPPAPHYRVSVWAFDILDAPLLRHRF